MKIGFFLSNLGGSPLQVGLDRGFTALGHHVVDGQKDCDLLIVFNQSSHDPQYSYPQFPKRSGPTAFIDCAEYGWTKRFPNTAHDYWNTFAPRAMAHDTKNRVEQARLKDWLRGRSFPYFLREFSKFVVFPLGYHAIDYPIYVHSECHQKPDREEYLRRDLDLFVSWGASHPFRMPITQALRACHTRCEILVLEENGTPRMPQREYFARTRAAKCSVSFDGYGSSSFRLHEVLGRCLLLAGPLSIDRYAPLVDGVHFREYAVDSIGEDFVGTNVCKVLRQALDDPEESFKIYEQGYYWNLDHYTEQATAEYVLRIVEAHDWSKETPLDNPA